MHMSVPPVTRWTGTYLPCWGTLKVKGVVINLYRGSQVYTGLFRGHRTYSHGLYPCQYFSALTKASPPAPSAVSSPLESTVSRNYLSREKFLSEETD